MMMWWSPEALYQTYLGTDAEFFKVALPTATQQCLENRVEVEDRCSDNLTVRVGSSLGDCGEPTEVVKKVILRVLYDLIYTKPEAIRSPAYDALNLFSISELQLAEIFDNWKALRSPREAICQWVTDNMDVMRTYIPRTYPRVFKTMQSEGPLLYSAMALGGTVTLLVLLTSLCVYRQRGRRVMRFAQPEFLWLLLSGALILVIGAIVLGAHSTDASCVASVWLINLGYTLELVPLIVKVAALNRLMHAALKMRRVVLKRTNLFSAVALISAFVVIFLILWTVLDPPRIFPEYVMTSSTTDDGETIVIIQYYCGSESNVWKFVSAGWNTLLLLCASVLAFQSRKIQQDFNESQTLAILIYSHFVFVMLRVATFFLPLTGAAMLEWQSIIFSFDTLATVVIYFLPKFLASDDVSQRRPGIYSSSMELSLDTEPPRDLASVEFLSKSALEVISEECSSDEPDEHNSEVPKEDDSFHENGSESTPQDAPPHEPPETQVLLEKSIKRIACLEEENRLLRSSLETCMSDSTSSSTPPTPETIEA